jgi:polar amino acid transport system substrate-binding protein
MVELTKLIFEKYGHTIDFQIVNWARAVRETRKNKVTALIGCSHADGPDFVYPAKPIGIMKNHYYVRQDSAWVYRDINSLEGKRIGIINGYSYGDSVDRLIKAKHKAFVVISGERPLDQMVKMMEAKRLDAFVENPVVLRYSLAQMKKPLDAYKAVSMNLADDPYLYVSFAPTNPKSSTYAQMIAKGISELRQTGELKKILDKYGISDWEETQITIISSINHNSKRSKIVLSP